jgi:hypothetical protein
MLSHASAPLNDPSHKKPKTFSGRFYECQKQCNPIAKPDFRSAAQNDFKLGFVQPFRFCHVKWKLPSGKN